MEHAKIKMIECLEGKFQREKNQNSKGLNLLTFDLKIFDFVNNE